MKTVVTQTNADGAAVSLNTFPGPQCKQITLPFPFKKTQTNHKPKPNLSTLISSNCLKKKQPTTYIFEESEIEKFRLFFSMDGLTVGDK